jgi:small subunit ribosomal protein S2
MTNFQTVQNSIKKLKDIETMREDGRYDMLTKKERLQLDRQHESLMKNLAGIKDLNRLPDMLFIIDVRKEEIAVAEANRLGIPVVAVVDTNCSPEGVNHVIPGNDDALRAIRLFASRIADAILEGQQIATEGGVAVSTEETGEEAVSTESAALEPEIKVADKTWETAEATHEDSTAAGAAEADGASDEVQRVQSETQTASSEDMVEAREGQTEGEIEQSQTVEESQEEETNEASAS